MKSKQAFRAAGSEPGSAGLRQPVAGPAQVKGQVPAHQGLNQTQGSPALGKRVLRPAGRQPGSEQPGQGIQPVGDADRQPGFGRGQFVAAKARQVMFVDGIGHGFGVSPACRA